MADQPTYTRIPNDLIAAMPTLGNAELRVALAIARKTAGYQKECDRISARQLAEMTGLTLRNTHAAIQSLMTKGLIERTPAGKQAHCYSLKTVSLGDTDQNCIPSDTVSLGDTEPLPVGIQFDQKPLPVGIQQKKDSKERKKERSRVRDPALDTLAVIAYRETFKCWPNSTQRKAINDQVQDLDRWQKVLDDWHLHGWRPTNVKDMLDRYSQNGYRNGSSKLLRQSPGRNSERGPITQADLDKPL